MRGAQLERLEVQMIGQADHDRVGVRVRDRLLEIGRDAGHVVLARERLGALLRPGVDDLHTVAVPLAVQRPRVEEPDQARPEHRHPVAVHVCVPLLS